MTVERKVKNNNIQKTVILFERVYFSKNIVATILSKTKQRKNCRRVCDEVTIPILKIPP